MILRLGSTRFIGIELLGIQHFYAQLDHTSLISVLEIEYHNNNNILNSNGSTYYFLVLAVDIAFISKNLDWISHGVLIERSYVPW